MESSDFCARGSTSCAFKEFNKNGDINLGSFNDKTLPPFELKVHKSDLTNDRQFKIAAESQTSTGYIWLCVDILSEDDHIPVSRDSYAYYNDLLTRDYLMNVSRNGMAAHGISISKFTLKSEGTTVLNGVSGVGHKDTVMATITINKGISEGKYFVVIAYGSPFRPSPMACIKEIVVNVLP